MSEKIKVDPHGKVRHTVCVTLDLEANPVTQIKIDNLSCFCPITLY